MYVSVLCVRVDLIEIVVSKQVDTITANQTTLACNLASQNGKITSTNASEIVTLLNSSIQRELVITESISG